MTPTVTVLSDDGSINKSAEAWRAFQDEGTEVVAGVAAPVLSIRNSDDGSPAGPPVDDAALSMDQVDLMLKTKRWSLAIIVGDSAEVLDRDALKAAKSRSADVRLRGLTEDEKVALDAVTTAASGTLGRLAAAETAPLTLVATIATVGGGFGYAASKDTLARPGFMLAAAGVGVLGVILALLFGSWPMAPERIRLSRLDLVRERYDSMVKRAVLPGRVAVAVLGLAVVLAFFAIVPTASKPDPAATIGTPSTAQSGTTLKAHLTVSWKDLADDAKQASTTVLQDGKQLALDTSPKGSDNTVKQTVDVTVPASGDIEVRTAALDGSDHQVGVGFSRIFKVP